MEKRVNGSQQVTINPVEVAKLALTFLSRSPFTASERQAFDAVEMLLQAIAEQRVGLVDQTQLGAPTPPPIPEHPQ